MFWSRKDTGSVVRPISRISMVDGNFRMDAFIELSYLTAGLEKADRTNVALFDNCDGEIGDENSCP